MIGLVNDFFFSPIRLELEPCVGGNNTMSLNTMTISLACTVFSVM